MSLSCRPAFFVTFSCLLVACQMPESSVVLSQMPSMTFATPRDVSQPQEVATLPTELDINDSRDADVPEPTPTEVVPSLDASVPLVVDVPILPVEPSASPFPDLPHVGDLQTVCELFAGGSAKIVQAALPDSEETPGVVSDDGQRYDLEFGDSGNGFEGRVVFENTRTAVYGFYLGADVPFEAFLDDSMPLALESSKENPAGCAQVAVYHFVEILPGQVTLNFGPGTVERLSLVIERAQEADSQP